MTDLQDARAASGFSRRALLGAAGTAAAVGAVGVAAAAPAGAEEPFRPMESPDDLQRPNILVILADDMGASDLHVYGAPDVKTPNLDKLARSGVRYTQGYSAGAVCSPTRIALYTGRHPARIPGGLYEPIGTPSPDAGIPPEHPTLASLLRGVGYTTSMVGKWHGGYLPWFSPLKSGWDDFYGNYSGGVDYFSKYAHNGLYDLYQDETPVEDPRYYTDVIAEHAVDAVRRGAEHDQPWLLNLNFTSPHWPWEGSGDQAVSEELTARLLAGDTTSLFHYDGGSREKYVEMVENLDTNIGKVIEELRRTGQRRNTLILFVSDNGGERFSYNWPFSGLKASVNEGGIRVPMILSWPARIDRRQVDDVPVYTTDWTATLLQVAEAEPDPAYPLDGVSLLPRLYLGDELPARDMFWRTRSGRALRRDNLKYVRLGEVDHLYDVVEDSREQAELGGKRPDDLAELRAAWEAINANLLPYSA